MFRIGVFEIATRVSGEVYELAKGVLAFEQVDGAWQVWFDREKWMTRDTVYFRSDIQLPVGGIPGHPAGRTKEGLLFDSPAEILDFVKEHLHLIDHPAADDPWFAEPEQISARSKQKA